METKIEFDTEDLYEITETKLINILIDRFKERDKSMPLVENAMIITRLKECLFWIEEIEKVNI